MKLTVKLFGPIPLDKDNNQVQYVASINEMPGMVETGNTKKEAWDQLMISLQVKILYDSGITEILSSGETTGEAWVSVEEKPLVIINDKGHWETTDEGEKEFLAALEVWDNKQKTTSWWIKHCVIEDKIGLCVVGDDDNEPAGWQVTDVEYYMPLPKPPQNTKLK